MNREELLEKIKNLLLDYETCGLDYSGTYTVVGVDITFMADEKTYSFNGENFVEVTE